MASRSVHISDYAAAIAAGDIPGEFTETAPRSFVFPEIISENSRGARLVWKVWVSAQDAGGAPVDIDPGWLEVGAEVPRGVSGIIRTESYQISAKGEGAPRAGTKPTVVTSGKNLGKVNATNPVTQALRDALSKYNAQNKRAVTTLAAKAPADDVPAAEQPPPMLVKKINETKEATLDVEDFRKGIIVQRKFNGVRLVSYLKAEEVIMYSRTKGNYPGSSQIRAELSCALKVRPPVPDECLQPPVECGEPPLSEEELERLRKIYAEDTLHLDGEIYLHGQTLRWISGQARREKDSELLNFMVFDCFFPGAKAAGHDMSSISRQEYLDHFFEAARKERCSMDHIKRVENYMVSSLAEIQEYCDKFLKEGYEGAIARKDCAGYRYSYNNYHSSNLVKIKPLYDDEFTVVGYTQGTKGKDVGAVIWVCEVDPDHVKDPADKTFNVVPKDMTYQERYGIFECLGEEVDNDPEAISRGGPARLSRFDRDFAGRPLTVEFPERSSKTGKPVQAKALTFRTYEDNLSQDPVKRLYSECARLKEDL